MGDQSSPIRPIESCFISFLNVGICAGVRRGWKLGRMRCEGGDEEGEEEHRIRVDYW